jgi:hypothetical protein
VRYLNVAILAVLSGALVASAGPPPDVTSEVKARPGRIATIEAKTEGKAVRWAIGDPDADADLIPLTADGRRVLFSSPVTGRYHLLCWTADADGPSDAARVLVIVGDAPPVPPTPPVPPAPPVPADPLTGELQALYAVDATPLKAAHMKQLVALYSLAPQHVDAAATAEELAELVRKASAALLPPDAIFEVRRRVAAEVGKTLGDGFRPLTPELRLVAKAAYARVAKSLSEVKP